MEFIENILFEVSLYQAAAYIFSKTGTTQKRRDLSLGKLIH